MTTPSPAPVSRHYCDGRFGQIHYRRAGATGAARPLLLFHMSPYSGVIYETFMAEMGRDRLVIAIDTPGFGNSDAPPAPPTIPDYAAAMGDVMTALGLPDADAMGYHTGAEIALALGRLHPAAIHKIIMVSAPIFTAEELAAHRAQFGAATLRRDGAHLAAWWQSAVRWSMPERSLAQIAAVFPARTLRPDISWWGHSAAFAYDTAAALAQTTQPVLILNPEDDLWSVTPRAKGHLRQGRIHDLPGWSHGFLDLKTTAVAAIVREFLDGGLDG